MKVYNIKINGGKTLKLIIIVLSIIMLIFFVYSLDRIFINSGKFFINDKIENKDMVTLEKDSYTNILQAVHENLNEYVGIKIKFSGYVYRLIDFDENQFVLARDMIINEDGTQYVVVGFLCESKKIKDFKDGEWIEIIGEIEKGEYHKQEIPLIKVSEINKIDVPEDPFVLPPDKNYIPTNGVL